MISCIARPMLWGNQFTLAAQATYISRVVDMKAESILVAALACVFSGS